MDQSDIMTIFVRKAGPIDIRNKNQVCISFAHHLDDDIWLKY